MNQELRMAKLDQKFHKVRKSKFTFEFNDDLKDLNQSRYPKKRRIVRSRFTHPEYIE